MYDAGELYTWGKGRYGRLGHGDSEDQLRPKLVESLLGYRVIDVACGELTKMKKCLNLTRWILAAISSIVCYYVLLLVLYIILGIA